MSGTTPNRSPLCSCQFDQTGEPEGGDCIYHDFDIQNSEAMSEGITAYMRATGLDPEDSDVREPIAILLESVFDVYLGALAAEAYYSFADILPFLKEGSA